jgi:hypothetical protein
MHSPTPPKCSTRAIVALINNLGIVYHQYCSSSAGLDAEETHTISCLPDYCNRIMEIIGFIRITYPDLVDSLIVELTPKQRANGYTWYLVRSPEPLVSGSIHERIQKEEPGYWKALLKNMCGSIMMLYWSVPRYLSYHCDQGSSVVDKEGACTSKGWWQDRGPGSWSHILWVLQRTVLMVNVRIFPRGYLFVWLQYLVSKEEFLFLNSPRGFWSSLGQRPHFIGFIDFKLLKPPLSTILWILRDACPWSSSNDSYSLSDPTTLKTPPGDYETQNFSREDFI